MSIHKFRRLSAIGPLCVYDTAGAEELAPPEGISKDQDVPGKVVFISEAANLSHDEEGLICLVPAETEGRAHFVRNPDGQHYTAQIELMITDGVIEGQLVYLDREGYLQFADLDSRTLAPIAEMLEA